jgi:hypothetical protein
MSLRGRLGNVSDIAKNQHCHVGSVGNVGSQKAFVGELMIASARNLGPVVLLMTLTALSAHRGRSVPQ